MRLNKTFFWISVALSIVFVALICFFSNKEALYYKTLNNISISFLTTCLFSIITTFLNYEHIKHQHLTEFYSKIKTAKNRLIDVFNWYEYNYEKINYNLNEKPEKLSNNDYETYKNVLENQNDRKIDLFLKFSSKIYDTNEFNNILDDYVGLIKAKTEVKLIMLELRKIYSSYETIYNKQMSSAILLFKQEVYPLVVIYKNVIVPLKPEFNYEKFNEINNKINCFVCKSKINKFINKVY